MNTTALFVREDGTVHGLYTEVIDLASLGSLQIKRASSIEFDNPLQVWRVFNRGRCLYCAPSRQACLEWERKHLDAQEELKLQKA
jgi:hypothetical protein